MKFTAAGDALLQQRIPRNYEGFAKVRDFIEQGDARFFNLETTLNYAGECFASQFSGGTYVRTDPEGFEDLLEYGFNMTSFNNNHTMDFSYEGMLRTLRLLRPAAWSMPVWAGIWMRQLRPVIWTLPMAVWR